MGSRQITITVQRAVGSPSEGTVVVYVRDAPGALQPSLWVAEGKQLRATLVESMRRSDRDSVDLDGDTFMAGLDDPDVLAGFEIELADVASRDAFEAFLAGITAAGGRVSIWCYEAKASRFLKLFGVAAN